MYSVTTWCYGTKQVIIYLSTTKAIICSHYSFLHTYKQTYTFNLANIFYSGVNWDKSQLLAFYLTYICHATSAKIKYTSLQKKNRNTLHIHVPKGLLERCLLLKINIKCYLVVGVIRFLNLIENVLNSN